MPEITVARKPPGNGREYILNEWTYNLPTDPIPGKEINEKFEADIVIVGAGTSGKAAALSASSAHAKVIQIDRHTTYRYSGGIIAAIDSRLQKKLGIKNDKDDVCLQLMRYAGNHINQRLIRLWADYSGNTMDWIMDMTDPGGIETLMYQWPLPAGYDIKSEYYPEFTVGHHQTDGTNIKLDHSLALRNLEKAALKNGVEIRYRTRAMQLIRQGNKRVTGVIARDINGRYIQFNAHKAIILCTGDYGNNPWMMQRYCPIAAEIALENNIYMIRNEDLRLAPEPLNTGDGHQMAIRIGAVIEPGPHAPMSHATAGPMGNSAFLRVNLEGERYENEDVPAQNIANSLVRQPGKKAWQVFDSKWEKELHRMGAGLGRYYEPRDMIRQNVATEAVKADTIRELARKMNVPVEIFEETVKRYNYLTSIGKDLDFAKRPDRLTSIDKPPFYAGLSKQEFLVVLGGLNTNVKLQPLDADRKIIPGLYLAGNTVGNRFAIDYTTMCPGLTHGMAYVTGRLAGQYAAKEKA